MKAVALLSGGKDSIYNVMKCVQYGHDIICIGNLRPSPKDVDELDSEMYQTVGWNGVELIAKAMDVPFYFRTTDGKSKQSAVAYNHLNINNDQTDNDNESKIDSVDEVEDMFLLLQEIKHKHPEINAVSTGAILSNYQRNRVESVCVRLNLVNLSYLWQRTDQNILLKEMINNDINAIIIKCASMGLLPNEFLGKSIQDDIIYDKLLELGDLYGMNVCGEGGEYETFVIDCPLFKKFKISIDESSICGDIKDPISPNGYLKFHKLSLVSKKQNENQTVEQKHNEMKENDINIHICNEKNDWELLNVDTFIPFDEPQSIETTNICNYGSKNGMFQFVSHPNSSINSKYISDLDLKAEVSLLFNVLIMKLKKYELNMSNLFYCQLFINDMNLFKIINPFYKSYFKNIFPPSRVCCQLDLNNKHRVSLEALGYKYKYKSIHNIEINHNVFQCLHVQSISEWAPNCIGPYSQASKIENKFIFAAGVIGLIPATMKMIPNNKPIQQIDLTWTNINAVLTAFDSNLLFGIHHNIFVLAAPKTQTKIELNDNIEYNHNYPNNDIDDDNIETDDENENENDKVEINKNESIILSKQMDPYLLNIIQHSVHKNIITAMDKCLNFNAVIIYVPDLPRHALIEVQTLALTKHCLNELDAARSEPYSIIDKVTFPPRNDNDTPKRKIRLKYAHIKRKKKHREKIDIYKIYKEYKENDIGNVFCVKTKTVYNLYDKWCSIVSICELTSEQNANNIFKLIKSALSQSILYLNGYGFIIQNQNHVKKDMNDENDDEEKDYENIEEESCNDISVWSERSIVFLRLYYNAEVLEPKGLLSKIESCFQDIGIDKVPAISLIPCRGVCFVNDKNANDISHNFGLYMLHCFLHEQ